MIAFARAPLTQGTSGYSTSETAGLHGVTSGRVSQVRCELHDSWSQFHGEAAPSDRCR